MELLMVSLEIIPIYPENLPSEICPLAVQLYLAALMLLGTFTNRATIDVIADSNGDLITGYKNGASGDRFNVKLDTADESAIVSSGGGYELKLYSESGQITFEGMDMFNPVLFTFNGETEMNGNTVIEGTATADLFIGDGGGLTNLPTPSISV